MSNYTGPLPGGVHSVNHVTAPTLIKASKGVLHKITIITAPTGAGGMYDSATLGGISTSNQIDNIGTGLANTTVFNLDWPCANGIVIDPGTGGVVSVSYS